MLEVLMLDHDIPVEVVRHFCQIASHRLGVDIGAGQHALVAGRVAKRMQALQVDFDEYLNRLDDDQECTEVVGFLDFLRPRPPRFFARRDDHMALHSHLVRCLSQGKRRIRLWSAGCGTGEEAYGMALTALGAVEAAEADSSDVDIKILATDISKAVVDRGKQGVFHEDQLSEVPRVLRDRYFRGAEDGMAIDENLRDVVRFRRLVLTSLPYPMTGPLDAIFCHEGLRPLTVSARVRVTRAMKDILATDGLWCSGFSDESTGTADDKDLGADPSGGWPSRRQGHC